MAIKLSSQTKLLFIGDSITDCGRTACPEQLGSGYPRLVRDYLRAKDPAAAPQVINKGISGNRVLELQARWDRDVLEIRPDILSIKIGINDVWHGLGGNTNGVSIDRFIPIYQELLQKTRQALPACKLVLCEPSVIWAPAPAEGNDILKPYVRAVNDLARQFKAECVVPLHSAFERARELRPDIAWTGDGVHPTSSGHMLIARTWLAATGTL